MKALGLNPTETEIQDLINEVERNGFIYYPAFCRVIMRKLREDDEENFRRELFRVLVGPKKYPDGVPAQLYNINKEVLTFEQVGILDSNPIIVWREKNVHFFKIKVSLQFCQFYPKKKVRFGSKLYLWGIFDLKILFFW